MSDGATSRVYYTADGFETSPTWLEGAEIDGSYTVLRATDVSGGIMLYSPDAANGTWSHTFDFTVSDGGFSPETSPQTRAAYVAGVGWHKDPARTDRITFYRAITATDLTSISLTITSCTLVSNIGLFPYPYVACTGGVASDSGLIAGANFIEIDVVMDSSVDPYVTSLTLTGDGSNPFGGGSNTGATVVYSTDNGSSWSDPISVGTSPGSAGGFDVQRVGDVSIAAADGQAYIATTKGGAYSSLGSDGATSGSQPILLLLPWSRWESTELDNWSTSTPDYLLGSSALVSGECLWRVSGSGGRVDITPPGVTGMVSPNCAATYLGTRIAVIASVSGTRHLFTSVDAGDNWTDRGALGSTAAYIRPLYLSKTLKQLFWVDGDKAYYSPDFGATIVTKDTPSTGTLKWIEPYG
jgi:hypothetical protein